MSKKSELAKNTLILALGKGSYQLAAFLLIPLYTAYLTPKEYGIFDLITSYVLILSPILTLQLEMAAFRLLIDSRDNPENKVRIISTILLTDCGIILLIGILFAVFHLMVDSSFIWPIFIYMSSFTISGLFMQIARGLGDNKLFARTNFVMAIGLALFAVLLVAKNGLGLEGAIYSLAATNIIATLYLFFALKLHKKMIWLAWDYKVLHGALKYSTPLIPNSLSLWAISVSDRTIISIILGTAANGIYAISTRFSLISNQLFGIFYLSWTETASKHINDEDRNSFFSEITNDVVRIFGGLGIVMIPFIHLVFPVFVDNKFADAKLYIPMLIIGVFLSSLAYFYGSIYIAKMLTMQVAKTSFFAMIMSVAINVSLIGVIGIWAAVISSVLSWGMVVVYRHYDIKKYVRIVYSTRTVIVVVLGYMSALMLYYWSVSFAEMLVSLLVASGFTVTLNIKTLGILASGLKRSILNAR